MRLSRWVGLATFLEEVYQTKKSLSNLRSQSYRLESEETLPYIRQLLALVIALFLLFAAACSGSGTNIPSTPEASPRAISTEAEVSPSVEKPRATSTEAEQSQSSEVSPSVEIVSPSVEIRQEATCRDGWVQKWDLAEILPCGTVSHTDEGVKVEYWVHVTQTSQPIFATVWLAEGDRKFEPHTCLISPTGETIATCMGTITLPTSLTDLRVAATVSKREELPPEYTDEQFTGIMTGPIL